MPTFEDPKVDADELLRDEEHGYILVRLDD